MCVGVVCPAMPPKRTPRRRQVVRCWSGSQDSDGLFLPNWKAEQYPKDLSTCQKIEDIAAVGGFLLNKTLYAVVSHVGKLNDDSPLPQRCDSVYLHPDTMKQCSLTISQRVLLHTSYHTEIPRAAVCKVWPLESIDIDVVAVAGQVLVNSGVEERGLVCVDAAPHLSTVTNLFLNSHARCPLDTNFECYLLRKLEGVGVCEGNVLEVQFHGEAQMFDVTSITLSSTSCHKETSCLADGIANLSLNNSLTEGRLSPTCSLSSTPTHHQAQLNQPSSAHDISQDTDDCSPTATTTAMTDTSPLLPAMGKLAVSTKIHFMNGTVKTRLGKLPSLCDVGGLQEQVQLLNQLVMWPLTYPELTSSGQEFPHGLLLHGPTGAGKSLLARALLGAVPCHQSYISAAELLVSGEGCATKLEQVMSDAQQNAPSLVVVDDIDILCPRCETGPSDAERKATAVLFHVLDSLTSMSQHVVLLATTNRLEAIEVCLRRPGRFDREVEIPAPTAPDRRKIIDILLQGKSHSLTDCEIEELSLSAHGYVGADLRAVCQEAQRLAQQRVFPPPPPVTHESLVAAVSKICVNIGDMQSALCMIRPSAMREVAVEVPKVLWCDIGGQEEIKQKLRQSVEWPLKHPQVFTRLGIKAPHGVLLYGPPGCSKTMIARALATESGLNFISVKGPELFSKWVGDSERAVRQVFSRARRAAPSIIFFDEIDALAVHRNGEGSKVGDRVLAQLLTEMDGVEGLTNVLIVAATNRPDMIDKALLRPGRIDRMIYVPLPSTQTRREILNLQFRRTPTGEDVDVEELVNLTEGFSGAEVVSLVQKAGMCAIGENPSPNIVVHRRHFLKELSDLKPRTDAAMLQYFDNYQRGVCK